MKKLLVLLSALALTFTLATAEMKCDNGKCGGDKNSTAKCDNGKAGSKGSGNKCNKGSQDTKEAPKKDGKCGQGKCG